MVHCVCDIVRDFGLKFPNIPAQDAHFDDWKQAGFLKFTDVKNVGMERPIDLEKRMVDIESYEPRTRQKKRILLQGFPGSWDTPGLGRFWTAGG
jgi:hypothetical protein